MKDYLDPLKCEYCSKHVNDFVPPEIPDNPKLIVVGEAPGKEENAAHRPFVGRAGRVLRPLVPPGAIYVNAQNVFTPGKPTTDVINIERAAHLIPILNDYPGLPVVSLGAYAAQALMPRHRAGQKKEGAKKTKPETSMAGEVLWLYDRPVFFTYHPAYYFYAGEDRRILDFIGGYLKAATTPLETLRPRLNTLPDETLVDKAVVIDVETDSSDLPWYGGRMTLLGVYAFDDDVHPESRMYQFTPEWLEDPDNLTALQHWFDRQRVIVGHGVLFDILHSEAIGLSFDRLPWFDTIIAEKNRGYDPIWGYGLKATAHVKYSAPPWEAKFHTSFIGAKTKKYQPYVPMDFLNYNAYDLYYTARLFYDAPTYQGFNRLDNDYLKYAKQMMTNGLYVDRKALADMLRKYRGDLKVARAKGVEQAGLGPDFNFDSPKQLLPVVRRLAGEEIENTQEQTLMTVLDKHPFIQTILDVRGAEKQVEMLHEISARLVDKHIVHARLTVHGAKSSRMTSKEPNIQNWNKLIRRILISRY